MNFGKDSILYMSYTYLNFTVHIELSLYLQHREYATDKIMIMLKVPTSSRTSAQDTLVF